MVEPVSNLDLTPATKSESTAPLADRVMLQSILDAAVDGIITIDALGTIQSVNRAAERLFGYSAAELIGQNIKLLMPSPYREQHDQFLKNYLQTGEAKVIGSGREVLGQQKDGVTFPMYLSVCEVKANDSRMFTGLVHDMRELKQAEIELQQLNAVLEQRVRQRSRDLELAQQELLRTEKLATLGQLAGSVAHEIRNPLGVIKNAAYYLDLQLPSHDPEVRAARAEIRRALDTAGRIISELLDYAREPQPQSCKILPAELIRRAQTLVEIPENVSVQTEYLCGSAHLNVDVDQIERTLVNLILNAIQAMPDGGKLALRSKCRDGRIEIEITDSGNGIAPEDRDRIFEPLFSRKVKGIGLGLSLSRRYAQLNQGSLTFETEVGKGTTFRLTFPQA